MEVSAPAIHAYLIMAHNNPEQLKTVLGLLDDPRNSLYLHIDKKSSAMAAMDFGASLKHSKLTRVDSIATNWGGASLVYAELALLRAAIGGHHNYYHLISGADLPLKSQNEIHGFFAAHQGCEFVHFDPLNVPAAVIARVKYYYPLQELIGQNRFNPLRRQFLSLLAKILVTAQTAFGINRLEKDCVIAKGAQWFSISHALATYILERQDWIHNLVKNSLVPDEIFLQTLIINSPFKQRLYWQEFDNDYRACLRAIEWSPDIYTYRNKDFHRLIASDFLFARKFDTREDEQIIKSLVNHIKFSKHSANELADLAPPTQGQGVL